jgi:hypothetical protein
MKRSSSILVPMAFLAGAFAACGGGGGGFSSGSDAMHAAIRASCEKAFDCMSSYDAAMHNNTAFADSYGNSVDDCVTQTEAFITAFLGANYFDELDASIDAGRVTFNSDDAQTCIDAGSAETCDQYFGQNGATADSPPECDTTFVGTVSDGGDCTIDQDCATDGDSCDSTTMTCTAG